MVKLHPQSNMDFEQESFTDLVGHDLFGDTGSGFSFATVQPEAHHSQQNPFTAANPSTFSKATQERDRSYPSFVQQPAARPVNRSNLETQRKQPQPRSSRIQGYKDALNRANPLQALEARFLRIEAE